MMLHLIWFTAQLVRSHFGFYVVCFGFILIIILSFFSGGWGVEFWGIYSAWECLAFSPTFTGCDLHSILIELILILDIIFTSTFFTNLSLSGCVWSKHQGFKELISLTGYKLIDRFDLMMPWIPWCVAKSLFRILGLPDYWSANYIQMKWCVW